MTVSWTYDVECTVDGVDVTDALMRHQISGNQNNAIMSGPLEFVKRKLDALVTVEASMPVVITRKYVVTTNGTPANVNKIIFRGYTKTPEETKGRTTVQVQDKLKLLLDSEVNKVYGTASVPVDLGEIIYDIVTSAGLTATYGVTGATIQTASKTTSGMLFAHANSFTAVKNLIDALNWQLYYNPADDKVYAESKTFRSTNRPAYGAGDFSGKPRWTQDASQMCNYLTVIPAEMDLEGYYEHTFGTALSCSTGATLSITLPKRPFAARLIYYRPNLTTPYPMFGHVATNLNDPGRDPEDDFAFIPNAIGTNFILYQNIYLNDTLNDTVYNDFPAGSKIKIIYTYRASQPSAFSDDVSRAAYGSIRKTLSRSDLTTFADLREVGLQYLARFANPLEQVQLSAIQDPNKAPWLGQLCDIVDAGSGKTRTGMAVVGLELNYPGKRDTVTLGELNAITADYTTNLDERIKQLETVTLTSDYTQGQYTPLGYVDPGEGGTGDPASGGKVTVVSGVLTGPDGAAIHLHGINDSATLADACNARGGDWVPSSTTSCPVTDSGTIDTSSAEEIATFFYRYGLAIKAAGHNYVRLGPHQATGLDAFWTQYNASSAQFDKVIKSAAQGLECAGVFFSICMSGFAELTVAEGGDGYFNRRLTTSQTTQGDHLNDTGYPTDNILHKDSTSYDYFAGLCTHTGDLVGDFPHFVALELSNEPSNWRHCPVYWTVIYGDDYSTGGAVEVAMTEWGSGLAAKIRGARSKEWNIMNGWTLLAGPPYFTRATILPISNPANLIRDINDGMDIAQCHVYHFSPIFCDTANTGNCDGTVCGQNNIHTAIKAACVAAGMPFLNDEWGRYCNSEQVWVQSIADTMNSLGVHHACIVPASRYAIGSATLPTGWDSLPLTPAPEPDVEAKYTVTVSGSTYYAKDAGGTTLTSGSAAHTVINAAIAALTSGRTVKEKVKLVGSFALTGQIEPANYTILELDGTVAWGNAGAGFMVFADTKHDIEITGGTWDGKSGSRSGIYSAGNPIQFEDCTDVVFENLYVHHGCYDAIECINCSNVTVTGCELAYCYWDALMMAWCSDCLVENCHIHDITQGGVYFYTEDDSTAQSLDDNVIIGCHVERTQTSGLSFSPRGAEDSVSGGSIENNILEDCGTDGDHPGINIGFAVKGVGCVVKDNIITNPAGTAGGGIEFGVTSGSCTGNHITGAGEAGISITGNSNTVTGNTVVTCGSQGYPNVTLSGNNNTVTGNTISSTPNASINNTGTGNTTSPNTITNP